MATRPRPVPHVYGTGKNRVTIWGAPSKVAQFFPTLTPASAVDPVPYTAGVRSFTRKQYPGDSTPVSVGGTNRDGLKGGPATANTTPGRPFWAEVTTGTGTTRKTTASQFTVVGPFKTVRLLALELATDSAGPEAWVLRSPGGKGYPMKHPAA